MVKQAPTAAGGCIEPFEGGGPGEGRGGGAQGHANLASAFKDAARQDEAIASYRRALALRPDFPEAFANLVHSLQVRLT